jgi:hypothetical protein
VTRDNRKTTTTERQSLELPINRGDKRVWAEQREEEQREPGAVGDERGLPRIEPVEDVQCVICWESLTALPCGQYVFLDCGEVHCADCINAALDYSLQSESNFPLLCACKQRVNVYQIYHLLTQELLRRYDAVSPEWTSMHRTYAPTA